MPIEVGAVLEGTVTKILPYGAFVRLPEGKSGMIHISEIATEYVEDIRLHLAESQAVTVKVIEIKQRQDGREQISLSRKALLQREPRQRLPEPPAPQIGVQSPMEFVPPRPKSTARTFADPFEEMLHRFKASSEERISDLKKQTDAKCGVSRRRHAKG